MIEVALRLVDGALKPYSVEDAERLKEIDPQSVLRARITAATRKRSYRQLALYWACCQVVADNNDDPSWDTKEKVSLQVKIHLRHIEAMIVADGVVHVQPKSLGFDELPHLEACKYFERAWPVLAGKIGLTEDELLSEAEEQIPPWA